MLMLEYNFNQVLASTVLWRVSWSYAWKTWRSASQILGRG